MCGCFAALVKKSTNGRIVFFFSYLFLVRSLLLGCDSKGEKIYGKKECQLKKVEYLSFFMYIRPLIFARFDASVNYRRLGGSPLFWRLHHMRVEVPGVYRPNSPLRPLGILLPLLFLK